MCRDRSVLRLTYVLDAGEKTRANHSFVQIGCRRQFGDIRWHRRDDNKCLQASADIPSPIMAAPNNNSNRRNGCCCYWDDCESMQLTLASMQHVAAGPMACIKVGKDASAKTTALVRNIIHHLNAPTGLRSTMPPGTIGTLASSRNCIHWARKKPGPSHFLPRKQESSEFTSSATV